MSIAIVCLMHGSLRSVNVQPGDVSHYLLWYLIATYELKSFLRHPPQAIKIIMPPWDWRPQETIAVDFYYSIPECDLKGWLTSILHPVNIQTINSWYTILFLALSYSPTTENPPLKNTPPPFSHGNPLTSIAANQQHKHKWPLWATTIIMIINFNYKRQVQLRASGVFRVHHGWYWQFLTYEEVETNYL